MTQAYPLPDAALDADIAILGKKGGGKTYTAKGLVERLLDMGRRCFTPSTAAMLRYLAREGDWRDRMACAQAAGISPTSSGLGAGLRDLVVNGLAEKNGHQYRIADHLREIAG